MPFMDGYEATKQIKSNSKKSIQNVIVVAMTANALEGDRESCIEVGMDDYISKPISTEKIFHIIKKYGTQLLNKKAPKQHKVTSRDNYVGDTNLNNKTVKPKKLISYSKLVDLYSNVSIINTAINFYLEEYATTLRTLNVNLKTNDFVGLREELHSLKNSIIFFHIKDNTPKFISNMEVDCDNKDKKNLIAKYPRLKFRMRRIYNELVGIINREN